MLLNLANTKKEPTNNNSNIEGEIIFDEAEIVKVIAMIDTGEKFSTIVQKLKEQGSQRRASKYKMKIEKESPELPSDLPFWR